MKTGKAIVLVGFAGLGAYLIWRMSPGLQAATRTLLGTGTAGPGNVNGTPTAPADGDKPEIAGSGTPSLGGLGGAATGLAGLIAAGAAFLTWAIVDQGLFRGGEEGVKVNPARDAFFAQNFGGVGGNAGAQNCSVAIINLLTAKGIPWPQAEAARVELMDHPDGILAADTMAEYQAAAQRIAQLFAPKRIVIPT